MTGSLSKGMSGFKDRISNEKRNNSRRRNMNPVGDYRTRQKKRARRFEFSSKLDEVGTNVHRKTTDIMAEGLKSSNQNDHLIKSHLEQQGNRIKERLRQRSLASFNRSMGASKGGSFHIFGQKKKKTKHLVQRRDPENPFRHQNILGDLNGKSGGHNLTADLFGFSPNKKKRPPKAGGRSTPGEKSKGSGSKGITEGEIIIL